MTQLEQFNKQFNKATLKKENIKLDKVDSKWPYNYDANFSAFIATRNNISVYFCFTSEGKLIDKKTLPLHKG